MTPRWCLEEIAMWCARLDERLMDLQYELRDHIYDCHTPAEKTKGEKPVERKGEDR